MQQGSLQIKPVLQELLYITDGSLRMHLMLSARRQFRPEDVMRFKMAVRAILLCTLYSTLERRRFTEHVAAHAVFREFVGLPDTNWADKVDPLFDDIQYFLGDDCVRGLLLAIIGAARASGALSNPEFQIDRQLLFKWATETYQIPGCAEHFSPGYASSISQDFHDVHLLVPPIGNDSLPTLAPPVAVSDGVSNNLKATLTDRQLDVLKHLLSGKSNKGIGNALGITEGTVKIHLAAIFRTFKVKNRTEAAITAKNFPNMESMA
jgi:DNA-binding CsgD family transcriptional regulator